MNQTIQEMLDRYNVTDETRAFIEAGHQKMLINGEFVESASGETLTSFDPSNGEDLITVPSATLGEMDQAIEAARLAFEDSEWSRMTPMDRQALMHKLADTIEEHQQTLAELESIDAGKAISGCLPTDIEGSYDFLRYMAGWATKIDGATREMSSDGFGYTLKEPVGVVGAIVPWNWPLNMSMWKMAAPLAVGCTIVLKPAELTPMSILYLMKIWKEAGLPAGVINVVPGRGNTVGAHLAAHKGIDKVSFTGSTPVGQSVGKAAIENMKHVTLELGGKSPMVAFADANIDDIVEGCHNSVFFNSGQNCSAGSRLYVHKSIYEETLEAIAKSLDEVVLGDPLDPNTTQGPQISQVQFDKIMGYIEQGKKEGARVVCGGKALDRPGFYVEPTVFADTTNDMTIVQEEIFGPVLTVQAFEDDDEAMRLANDNIYGLAGSVFTQDITKAHKMVKRLKAGSISVNTHDAGDYSLPFGGYKMSGVGKDMGAEQLEHFLETKSVYIKL